MSSHASKVIELAQASDPKTTILKLLGDLSGVDVFHNNILIVTYIEPEKTAGGIIKPQKTLDESKWQGKVGLVVKKGPMAFVDDGAAHFLGQNVEPGDWISYRVSDGWQLRINGVECRMLEDSHVKLRVVDPTTIY